MIRILIPVYNEEKNISNCVLEIHKVLKKFPHRFYLVNDGSKDKSLSILNKLKRKLPATVLDHKINKGVAEAFKTGLYKINQDGKRGDVVAITEGDGTSTPTLLKEMVAKNKSGYDIVIASRYEGKGCYVNFPLKRLFLSRSANFVMGLFFPYPQVKDYTIFYRTYKIEIIRKAVKSYKENLIKTKFFTANAELLIKCMKFKPKITEVPYVYDYGKKKGSSGLKILKNILQYFKLIYERSILRRS